MATLTQISLAEYLDTIYHPDREYIDGEIRERNVGKYGQARLQWLLPIWFGKHDLDWNVTGCGEHRMRVTPTRIRIPELVVMRPGPQTEVMTEPPLLVIEILSPDDTYSELQERCLDYLQMGVENIWIIDPTTRTGRMGLGPNWIAVERLEVQGTPIYVALDDLFRQIDSSSASQTAG
jgi:Uma2 family endonuclease